MNAGAAPPSIPHNVFVYGSLMADEVVRLLLKRVPPSSSSATLHGLFSIRGRVYPAILPLESHKVDGKVLLGITEHELDVLDKFEDEEYERITVNISLAESSEHIIAATYVWGNKEDPNLYGNWDFEEWKQLHLKEFLQMTAEFAEELEQP